MEGDLTILSFNPLLSYRWWIESCWSMFALCARLALRLIIKTRLRRLVISYHIFIWHGTHSKLRLDLSLWKVIHTCFSLHALLSPTVFSCNKKQLTTYSLPLCLIKVKIHKAILAQAVFKRFLGEVDWPFDGKIEPCEVESA